MKYEQWYSIDARIYFGDGGIDISRVPNPIRRARLIASAPEMLMALIECRSLLSAVDACSRNNFASLASERIRVLDGLIAEADGESE